MDIKYSISSQYMACIKEVRNDRNIDIIYKVNNLRICISIEENGYIVTSILNTEISTATTTTSRLIPFFNGSYLFISYSIDNFMNTTVTLYEMRD